MLYNILAICYNMKFILHSSQIKLHKKIRNTAQNCTTSCTTSEQRVAQQKLLKD